MEVELNWETTFKNVNAIPYNSFVEYYAFLHDGKTVNFLEFPDDLKKANESTNFKTLMYLMPRQDT